MSTTYYKNGASITFADKTGWKSHEKSLTANQIDSGFDTSLSTVSISGSSVVGKTKKITSLKIVADEGKYFSIPPYLKGRFKNRIRLEKIKVEKNGNKPTTYMYDLVYTRSKTPISNLSVEILYKTDTIPVVTTSIRSISFGSNIINSGGENRTIKINGSPGAVFGIAINENVEEITEYTTTDIDGATARSIEHSHVDKINDVSILKRHNTTSTYNYAKDIKVIKGTINSTGVYSFNQIFPSIISNKTNVKGTMAESGATKIKFDNLTNVRPGDRIYSSNIPSSTVVKVAANGLNPDEDDVNECTLDTSVTLLDNAEVVFKRKKCYSIDIIPDLTSTLDSSIPTTDPEYRLYQYMDPVLTVRNSISGTDMTITHNNGAETGLERGEELDITYTGKAGVVNNTSVKRLKNKSKFNVSMLLDIHNSDNFTAVLKPTFSNTDQSKSSWTNSVAEDNGGTKVDIYGIKWSATGNNTITLKYNVDIKKWGTKDVVMELDLDDITTIA